MAALVHTECFWVCLRVCYHRTCCDFNLQVIDINFDYDTIKKQYVPSSPNTEEGRRNSSYYQRSLAPSWIYNSKINDSSSGYQLTQLCNCYYTVSRRGSLMSPLSPDVSGSGKHPGGGGEGKEVPGEVGEDRRPVMVNQIQYSTSVCM